MLSSAPEELDWPRAQAQNRFEWTTPGAKPARMDDSGIHSRPFCAWENPLGGILRLGVGGGISTRGYFAPETARQVLKGKLELSRFPNHGFMGNDAHETALRATYFRPYRGG